jgi:ATP-dependent Clp protease protease subunit
MNSNLLRLYALNRNIDGRRFEVKAQGDETTVYVYDVIVNSQAEAEWFGGVAPETFVRALADISAPTIHLRINSPGGSVFGARAMEQAIREHSSKIIAHVDGYAASAASFLMLPADEIEISPGGMVMIHKAWALAYGNADDMIDMAALLEKIDGTLVASYMNRTGQDAAQIAEWMAAETWFTAEEAVENGFADRIAGDQTSSSAAAAIAAPAWNLAAYLKGLDHERQPAPVKPDQRQVDFPGMARRAAAATLIQHEAFA